MTAAVARRNTMRRYPGLAFLAVAALLAVALPSALTLPNAGPPTLAEFAPVPGRGQSAGGDLNRLGAGSSGEVGFRSGDGSPPGQPGLDPGQPGGAFKRCVGSPPRQTEDPLSPPCVAFFEGDNRGATARGVTRDEVKVVVYFRTGSGAPPEGTLVDYAEPPFDGEFEGDVAMKVYAQYFNYRYQTYGRRVHLYGFYGPSSRDATPARRRADAQQVDGEQHPFATIPLFANPIVPYVQEATRRGMLTVTFDAFTRARYADRRPLLWGVLPDLQDEAALAAGYICRKLAGRPASHSGNVTDLEKERTFGIVFTESVREPEYAALRDLLKTELSRRCGVSIDAEAGASEVIEEGQREAATKIAALRAAGVTTVIVAALPNTVLAFADAASAAGWVPEWFVPGRRGGFGVDRGADAKVMPQAQWRHAFGITFSPRWGGQGEMHWSRAYAETCECSVQASYGTATYYEALAMLFYGIQAAGPQLTTANFDKGMHAIPPRPSANPYTTAAYFRPGNYSYVKDAMEIWWDPSGQAPGSEGSPGCYRIPNDGTRFRAGEWLSGDSQAFRDGPCNGDAPIA